MPENFVTLPRNNILCIQMLHLENPYERNLGQFFIGIKKVLVFTIFTKPNFFFVTSITTQQFNNHRTVQ